MLIILARVTYTRYIYIQGVWANLWAQVYLNMHKEMGFRAEEVNLYVNLILGELCIEMRRGMKEVHLQA